MSIIFSKVNYAWEDDPNIKQVLVFSSSEAQDKFNKAYNDPCRIKTISGFPGENGIGAIFKLRAIRTNEGKYESLIRCGVTGALILEDYCALYENYNAALNNAAANLAKMMVRCVPPTF